MASVSDAIRFPNVIGWFGVGGHEFWLVAGEMGMVRPFVSLVEVAGAVGARFAGGPEKRVREEIAVRGSDSGAFRVRGGRVGAVPARADLALGAGDLAAVEVDVEVVPV
jgi:hypothetical protein